MHGDHLQQAVTGIDDRFDRRSRLAAAHRDVVAHDRTHGKSANNGVTEIAIGCGDHPSFRRMPTERRPQIFERTPTKSPRINFLESDDVWIMTLDQRNDSSEVAIKACGAAAVDVPSHHPYVAALCRHNLSSGTHCMWDA